MCNNCSALSNQMLKKLAGKVKTHSFTQSSHKQNSYETYNAAQKFRISDLIWGTSSAEIKSFLIANNVNTKALFIQSDLKNRIANKHIHLLCPFIASHIFILCVETHTEKKLGFRLFKMQQDFGKSFVSASQQNCKHKVLWLRFCRY